MNPGRTSRAVLVGAVTSIVSVVVLTVLADLVPSLKDALKNAFTHHWVGKGVIVLFIFLLVSFVSYATRRGSKESDLPVFLRILTASAIWGTILIFGFFLYEIFSK